MFACSDIRYWYFVWFALIFVFIGYVVDLIRRDYCYLMFTVVFGSFGFACGVLAVGFGCLIVVFVLVLVDITGCVTCVLGELLVVIVFLLLIVWLLLMWFPVLNVLF